MIFDLFLEKFKTQVDQIEDLWNDLVPTDDSYNLADSSFPAMDFSIPTGKYKFIWRSQFYIASFLRFTLYLIKSAVR